MKRTIDYYCARVEDAYNNYMNNPRTLNNLLDAVEEMKAARHRFKQDKSNQLQLFK